MAAANPLTVAVIGAATAWNVLDGMSLFTAVEPVAMAMCDTAVSDGVAVTFCRATTPRLTSASPPLRGRTPWSMYF